MAANIRHSSETVECYTPVWLVERGIYVTGGFDVDPASCEFANRVVRATRIHTAEDNGLWQPWYGRVFLNPPGGLTDAYGRTIIRGSKGKKGCTETGACGLPPGHVHKRPTSSAAAWWWKICYEWQSARTTVGLFVGFSLELLQSAQGLGGPQPLDFPYCIPKDRIDFDEVVDGERVPRTDPTHSNIIVLVGGGEAEHWRFTEAFADVGYVAAGWRASPPPRPGVVSPP